MKSRSVQLDGHTLSVRWMGAGDPSAPVVAMVHGMMESSMVWEPIVDDMPAHWQYALIDLPWNGLQAGHWGLVRSPDAWLNTALVALGLRPDAFVAHSFGASVLLAYLATHAPGGMHKRPAAAMVSPFYKRHTADFSWPLLRRYVTSFPQFVEDSIVLRSGAHRADPALMARMVETSCETFGVYNWMEFWRLFARMPRLDLLQLSQPVFVLSGTGDFSSPPEDQHALLDALPCGTLELVRDARHFLLDSHPVVVVDSVTRFLSSVLPCGHPGALALAQQAAVY